ncbi:protein lyk5 [Phtheirospermum japonicum]|uniref:Protein lyk5 n=1 Tax=Phtheirospermum japonicum TaxID=374723 RepID=A0A830BM27_9LAMI|nr:protein lyk5 [Phtheirospermum japonicum]
MISHPSNISAPNTTLTPDQPLFVPITCSCNTVNSSITISYAALNYTILRGDTFYLVSTNKFQNLTTYQSVEVVNPTFVPTQLDIGDVIVFPIFCRCPNPSELQNRVNYLISYVFHPSDRLSDVAARFGSTQQSIIGANGNNIRPWDTIFVPVSRLPNLTQPVIVTPPPPNPAPNPLIRSDEDNEGAVIGLGIGLGICGIMLILVCGIWCYRERLMRKKGKYYRSEEERKVEKGKNGILKVEEMNLMADVSGCLDKYKVFKLEELKMATEGFDDKCLIQGSVYKGCIDGEWFAIKKMKWNAYEELKILQKVNHGSLVRLEGFCIDPQEANCYLVYEYIENGSLHSWLHEQKPEKLSWKTRLKIAIDIANGLQYIHEHTRPKVVHKDIKSSNILLDSNMRAKIANFGLAKSGCNAITMHIVGTQGYIAPEYLSDGVVSTKMDVFAFGVVLLELVSGREAVDGDGDVLWESAGRVLKGSEAGRVREWMGECHVEEEDMEGVMSVVNVGVACLNRDPGRRPSMVEIVYALSKSGDNLLFDVSGEGFSPRPVAAR